MRLVEFHVKQLVPNVMMFISYLAVLVLWGFGKVGIEWLILVMLLQYGYHFHYEIRELSCTVLPDVSEAQVQIARNTKEINWLMEHAYDEVYNIRAEIRGINDRLKYLEDREHQVYLKLHKLTK